MHSLRVDWLLIYKQTTVDWTKHLLEMHYNPKLLFLMSSR